MSATDDVLRCFSTDGHPGIPASVERLPTVGEVNRAITEVELLRADRDEYFGDYVAIWKQLQEASGRVVELISATESALSLIDPDRSGGNSRLELTKAHKALQKALKGGEVKDAVAEIERLRFALEIIRSQVDPNTAVYEVADDALKGGES